MKIKFITNIEVQILGEDKPWKIDQGTILETTDIESHENDEDTVDIHLVGCFKEEHTVFMYVPITSFIELPMV